MRVRFEESAMEAMSELGGERNAHQRQEKWMWMENVVIINHTVGYNRNSQGLKSVLIRRNI
ncbi:hypothetical protein [Bacillus niameyensis]|uniref:hypothetical protein n=1 Tax=Bacillus niameyensis TaxID=1522308 RepID=UPI0007855E80|nr:hypothetical protein [Bacillus niameyensis]